MKTKPAKKQKLENTLVSETRRADGDRKSPSVLKVLSNEDTLNNHEQNDDNSADQSPQLLKKISSLVKRRSNRGEKSQSLNSIRSEISSLNEEKSTRNSLELLNKNSNDSTIVRSENLNEKTENVVESLLNEKVEKKDKDTTHEELASNNVTDLAPPRKRAAALAAAVSVAETVNPQRSASPRKRISAGKIYIFYVML